MTWGCHQAKQGVTRISLQVCVIGELHHGLGNELQRPSLARAFLVRHVIFGRLQSPTRTPLNPGHTRMRISGRNDSLNGPLKFNEAHFEI